MVVCLSPEMGFFVRINTKGWRPGSVPIALREHPFLNRDSHVECGSVFELDDYLIEQSIDPPGRGIVGTIARRVILDLRAAIVAHTSLRDEDRDDIVAILAAI